MEKPKRRDTKEALIRAAERLFAAKGLGGVTVRDITLAAGARNQSALHYHFGGMEELVKEVFASRFQGIEEQRLRRLAEIETAGQNHDVHALVRAGIAPMLETCLDEEGRLYARFSVQLLTDPRYGIATLINDVGMTSVTLLGQHLMQAIENVPHKILSLRLRRIFVMSAMIMADYAGQVEAGKAPPVEDAIDEATTSLVGFLVAR